MKPSHPSLLIRQGLLLNLIALLSLAPLAPLTAATSFAPQDSTHIARTYELLPGEDQWRNAKVANQRIWYTVDSYGHPLRARNFAGELVFEKDVPNARLDYGYDVAADGRLYVFTESSYRQVRVTRVSPEGTILGDFGPNGPGEGWFDAYQEITVSPVSGRVYVSDELFGRTDPARKGLVRVFDRDGNYLHDIRTSGILASTLENGIVRLLAHADEQGQDELYVIDSNPSISSSANFKVFGGDGQFRRLVTGGIFSPNSNSSLMGSVRLWEDRLLFGYGDSLHVAPSSVANGSEVLAQVGLPQYCTVLGVDDRGGLIGASSNKLWAFSYPNFSNFDAVTRNAVPNPWVLGISQRPGTATVDVDYRVDDLDDATVTTALVALANGEVNLGNILPMNRLTEGTASRVGTAQPTGTVQRVTWDAGSDWNVDFGTLRVMALARDSRSHWFDVHLVEIPADGPRPAVTISRLPLTESDFLGQFLWLVATKDPSVRLVDGVLFGTSGAEDGVILASGATTTTAGREFLLRRDGLRLATAEEVTRAREGATPGFTVQLTPPLQMVRKDPAGSFPRRVNEFGIEASDSLPYYYNSVNPVYVVRESAE